MQERKHLYQKLGQTIKTYLPDTLSNQLETVSCMITGLLFAKCAHLNRIAEEVPHPSKVPSLTKRMERLLRNKSFRESAWYQEFMLRFLRQRPESPLLLTVDTTTAGRNCVILIVGVVFHKRSLPLCWRVYKGKKGHLKASRHIALFKKVRQLLGEERELVLLGDSEFDSVEVLEWLSSETNWDWVLRSAPNLKLSKGKNCMSFGDCPHEKGQILSLPDVLYTAKHFGPAHAVIWWEQKYKDPIYLVSNLEDCVSLCRLYQKRFSIETMFSDKKSRGFGIDKSHISNPKRLSRLLFTLCVAYLWMIWLGRKVLEEKWYVFFARTDRVDLSLFRLGLGYIKHCLRSETPFPFDDVLESLSSVR